MEHRDRAEGWRHAKLSGHENERLVKDHLDHDPDFQRHFLQRIDRAGATILDTSIGGLHETEVPGVHGRKTKSKTDLKVCLDTKEVFNISIKKSFGGQVYIVREELFISTFEKQFHLSIPSDVQRAIRLFWAAAEDAVEVIEQYADRTMPRDYALQLRHKSLNAATLRSFDAHLYAALVAWFAENAYEIAKLSFSMGAVRDRSEWSDFVWYINFLGENDRDDLFSIEEVCKAAREAASRETYYGASSGGTTIQLPFGFVQWHQGQLQFHHSYDKIRALLSK